MKFINEKGLFLLLVFLLFIFPSILFVNYINELTFHFTMNSKFLFKFISFTSLLFLTIIFSLIFVFIKNKIKNDSFRKAFIIIVIASLIILGYLVLVDVVLFTGLFTFESCGENFNELYMQAAKDKKPSFCFRENIKVNTFEGFKGRNFCKTPNKDIIGIEPESNSPFISDCLESFASYVGDVKVCEKIISSDINLTSEQKESIRDSCIQEYEK